MRHSAIFSSFPTLHNGNAQLPKLYFKIGLVLLPSLVSWLRAASFTNLSSVGVGTFKRANFHFEVCYAILHYLVRSPAGFEFVVVM